MSETLRLEIHETIKRILTGELAVSASMLADADSNTPLLGRGIGLDSVESMVLATHMEQEFEISIPDADLTSELFATIGSLTSYVGRKVLERLQSAANGGDHQQK
jgi:acyl carrier protein